MNAAINVDNNNPYKWIAFGTIFFFFIYFIIIEQKLNTKNNNGINEMISCRFIIIIVQINYDNTFNFVNTAPINNPNTTNKYELLWLSLK